MTIRSAIMKIVQQERLNFLLTNCMPRRLATQWMGVFSRIEHPLICALSLRTWGFFAELDLSDARQTRFCSMHDCFTRRLREGARPVDANPAILVSPVDAIIGACGMIEANRLYQIKGMQYELAALLGEDGSAEALSRGQYVTLRLTSAMYHRFHAPHACHVASVTHLFGDCWNVNPPTLRRVPRLFCRNERVIIRMTLAESGHALVLVPVAAILVAGIRLNFLDLPVPDRGAVRTTHGCDATLQKGEEMGWFEHGSTVIVLAPEGFAPCDQVREGARIRVGQPLMRLPQANLTDAPLS